MPEPRIQYARTEDGVSIAYFESGHGTPCVLLNDIPFSHIQLEARYMPGIHQAEKWARLVRLDPRGMGMSDREVGKFTLDGWLLDIDAVVRRLGVEQVVLATNAFAGMLGIAYATRHPEKVSRLVMLNPVARPADAFATPQAQSLAMMLDSDWEMFSENVAGIAFGWGREDARRYGEFIRACVTQSVARRVYAALLPIDLTGLLGSITIPTLVLHHSALRYIPSEMARRIVSQIPDSRLVVVEGVYDLNMDTIYEPIREFVLEGGAPTASPELEAGVFRTVLFTDIVGHTAMMHRLGDEKGRAVLREHEQVTRNTLKAHGGSEVKTMGDGFMASFTSITKGVECAIALQRAFDARNRGVGVEQLPDDASNSDDGLAVAQPLRTPVEPITVRVGLNAGEPIQENGDLFGETVILAARIAAKAEGAEILVADTVRGLCSGKGFLFADRGEFVAKGFEEPVRVYEVRWRTEG